jgi:hypothetical protein
VATLSATGGNNGSANAYAWNDPALLPGKAMYRLKIAANNGTVHYSNTVTVTNSCDVMPISVFPNPAGVGQGIRIASGAQDMVAYEITDANGQIVRTGRFVTQTEIKGLPAGIYIIRANNILTNITEKIIIR